MSEPLRSESEQTVELERTEDPGQRSAAAGPELDAAHRSLFDAVADPIFVVDKASKRLLDCNRAAIEIYGYSLDEFREMTIFDLHPRGAWDEVKKNVDNEDDAAPHRYTHVTRSGAQLQVEIHTELFEYRSRPAWVSVVREIGDRERATEALRQSEERYRQLVTMSPEATYVLRAERIIFANQAGARLLGFGRPDDLIGLSIYEFVHPDFLPLAKKRIRRLDRQGQVPIEHAKFLRNDGSAVDIEVEGAHITFQGESAVLVMAHDITSRKRQEERLRLERAYFERLFESAPQAIVIVDNAGAVVRANREFTELFGYSQQELIGQLVDEMIVPDDLKQEARSVTQAVARGKATELETRRLRKDGRLVDVSILGAPVQIDREQIAVYGIYTDITDRRRLERQLQQSHRMEAVGQLAGGIAHDFNNLLTAILGNCEILLSDLDARDPHYLDVEEIKRAGDRAASLTRQLLAFSRKQYLRPKIIDLNEIVRETESLLSRLIDESIELVTHLDPQLGHVKADPGQLEQVIVNLVINARDAMPEGGRLTIVTSNAQVDAESARVHQPALNGRYVTLSVADTGTGMDPQTQTRIFEPFFTTKEKGKGTGLGLSTVYGIVKQSGGHIWVDSEVGRGTNFIIHFPEVDADTEIRPLYTEEADPLGGSDTVLLVEDEEIVRNLLQRVLEKLGYNVLHARNAADALALSNRYAGPIDLLVTDVVMPGMNGRELARQLTDSRPGARVLYMSGYLDMRGRKVDLGPDAAFLQKPFTPDVLGRKIREVLDK